MLFALIEIGKPISCPGQHTARRRGNGAHGKNDPDQGVPAWSAAGGQSEEACQKHHDHCQLNGQELGPPLRPAAQKKLKGKKGDRMAAQHQPEVGLRDQISDGGDGDRPSKVKKENKKEEIGQRAHQKDNQ